MKIVFTGGGTGGHVNPALNIAQAVRKQVPDAEISFVGTKRGIESTLVPKAGYEIDFVEVQGFRRKLNFQGIKENCKAAYKAVASVRQAKKILKERKPDVVVGTGGYVSWPTVKAAAKLGIPCLIHEQNTFPGVTTKKLSRMVNTVCISFEGSEKYFSPECGLLIAPASERWKQYWLEWDVLEKSSERDFFRRELLAETILAEALLSMPKEVMQPRFELSPVIKSAVDLIVKNFADPLSNTKLAEECKVELRSFLRKFRQEIGESPQQYSRRLRIEKACQYLSYTDMSLDEIAEKTGFPDRYYFSRVFYQLQNVPPASFRRIQKKQIYREK